MSSTQTVLSEFQYPKGLMWSRDNPTRLGATRPAFCSLTARRYREDPGSLPYRVPTPGSDEWSRFQHRTYYWLVHDFEGYCCPDCDRPVEAIVEIDVHHIDGDCHNGRLSNLVGLCRRCHMNRHSESESPTTLYLDEWKCGFLELGGVEA